MAWTKIDGNMVAVRDEEVSFFIPIRASLEIDDFRKEAEAYLKDNAHSANVQPYYNGVNFDGQNPGVVIKVERERDALFVRMAYSDQITRETWFKMWLHVLKNPVTPKRGATQMGKYQREEFVHREKGPAIIETDGKTTLRRFFLFGLEMLTELDLKRAVRAKCETPQQFREWRGAYYGPGILDQLRGLV